MIAYASRTGTRRNLAALRAAGWRLMVSATGAHRTEGFRYALDNGAWTAYNSGARWDEGAFERLVSRLGSGADFIVAPDIVAGGMASLHLSARWLERLAGVGERRLIPVQDGMTERDVAPLLSREVGVFVGGSTEWKLLTMGRWAELARRCGAYCHVGRVNTAVRIRMCGRFGVDSFDGTSASRFVETLPALEAARAFWTSQRMLLP